jgi:hypothetical protein
MVGGRGFRGSIKAGQPRSTWSWAHLATLELGLSGMILATVVGVGVGVCALKRDSDRAAGRVSPGQPGHPSSGWAVSSSFFAVKLVFFPLRPRRAEGLILLGHHRPYNIPDSSLQIDSSTSCTRTMPRRAKGLGRVVVFVHSAERGHLVTVLGMNWRILGEPS